jgi:phytanoyl-CoA hydroxylase
MSISNTYITDAFDATGQLTKPKHRAINKIGHYLHELSPSFRAISLSARNTAIARSLGFRDPRVLQSMVICKQPEIGGAVPPHQDSTFLYTDPPSAVGWWYALEDATAENGCLSFAAGSHKRASIEKRFVRMGKGTGFIDNEGARFPENLDTEVNGEKEYEVVEKEEVYDMGEVKAGTLVLIHGNILHKSEKNTSDKSRNIYTFHVIEGERRYDERNWLQPPEKGFSMLFPKQAEMNELYKKKVTMLHEQWRDEKAGTNEHDADKAERLHETWSEEGAATKRSKLDKDEWLVEKRLDQRPPTNNVGTDASNRLAKDW